MRSLSHSLIVALLLAFPGLGSGSEAERLFLAELNEIPVAALRPRPETVRQVPAAFLKALKDYPADYRTLEERDKLVSMLGKDALPALVLRAVRVLKEENPAGLDAARILPPLTMRSRKAVGELQKSLGVAEFRLKEVAMALETARAEDRFSGISRRWQAHAELVHAIVLGRIILLHECNHALAQVRTDALPDLRPGDAGWQLIPAARLRTLEIAYKRLNQTRLALLADIATKHAATPWAFVAQRESMENSSFVWTTISGK